MQGEGQDTGSGQDRTTLEGTAPVNTSGPVARVVINFYHSNGVRVAELGDGESLVVGRSAPADVLMDVQSLSRRHARFWREGDAVWVEDLGSRNGTRMNTQSVERAEIMPGAVVTLGGVTAVVHRLPAGVASAPGLASYDQFGDRLASELMHVRSAGQYAAVWMVRADGDLPDIHVSRWAHRFHADLGPRDFSAMYDQTTLLVLRVGLAPEPAHELATRIIAESSEIALYCGISCYPSTATTGQELLYEARQACLQATADARVQLAAPLHGPDTFGDTVIVESPAMQKLRQLVRRVASADMPVLILGETGAGKEVVASALHRASARRDKPFRAINCAAIPETLVASVLFGHEKGAFTGATFTAKGVFEEADGGTVLLDEVGELSAAIQAALLRVLETKCVARVGSQKELKLDTRILAATHRDLEQMVEQRAFRRDLLFRLNAIVLQVPPLRERGEEIAPLAEHFTRIAAAKFGVGDKTVSQEALEQLRAYSWPGNVRELRNVVERAVILSDGPTLMPDHLPDGVRRGRNDATSRTAQPPPPPPTATLPFPGGEAYKDRVREYEVQMITEGLRRAEGNQTRAAELLRIPLRTLVHKMKLYGLRRSGDDK
jgi:DNA-binding NtrC family response regulator/pSer/pThr/pTyr-binding forkhead associated (FHA) protein